jgi:hypothetical protein
MGDFGRPRHQTASINDGTAPAANRAVFLEKCLYIEQLKYAILNVDYI